ncbi:MAG TPA: hypothetical protein VN132_06190 [Bdellovibrio sp.]|nr:hypothetical protein [Bdellovibrio sp.]
MRFLFSLFALSFSLNAMAEQLTYNCQTEDQKNATISFEKFVLLGETPAHATVKFSVQNQVPKSWTTSMFMGLPMKAFTYVEFRDEESVDQISLQISPDLKIATASIQLKDGDSSLDDWNCTLQ